MCIRDRKLLSLIMAACLLIIVWLNGEKNVYSILTGSFSIASCLVMSIIAFYYVGIVNARLKQQLHLNFKVFICFNYLFSLASVAGFGYTVKTDLVDGEVTLSYKQLYTYGIIIGIGVYYLLGVTMFVFLMGYFINIGKFIWYHFEFLFNILTARLFTAALQEDPKVLPIQYDDTKVKNLSHADLNITDQLKDLVPNANGEQLQHEKQSIYLDDTKNLESAARVIQKKYSERIQTRICVICKKGFILGESIVGLTCNAAHIFHPLCLGETRSGVDQGQGECPVCYRTYII
eukprot:TRINITY_DN20552_c0_g2_i1.p1 TRINITY_DN20552_c0_g2~~TRINITY_DN20552_c0_g2_i1.p1  ORF type:complete len:290 (+),score=47.63 TRINITY_DN20552_c0_g2_i1:71-940(+)